jgi:hypothetical protein
VRTTLTIDDDVAALLQQEVRRSGDPLKVAVNRVLRLGLIAAQQQPQLEPFVVTPFDLKLPAGLSFDNIGEILDALEGPARR